MTGSIDAELVDRVVSAARSARFRRGALQLAVGLALAATIGAPVLLVSTHEPRGAFAVEGAPTADAVGSDRTSDTEAIGAAARRFIESRVHRPIVTFGRLRATADRAELRVRLACGPHCRHGETLLLVRGPTGWHVTGTNGDHWPP